MGLVSKQVPRDPDEAMMRAGVKHYLYWRGVPDAEACVRTLFQTMYDAAPVQEQTARVMQDELDQKVAAAQAKRRS